MYKGEMSVGDPIRGDCLNCKQPFFEGTNYHWGMHCKHGRTADAQRGELESCDHSRSHEDTSTRLACRA